MLKAAFLTLALLHPALFAQPQATSDADRLIATGKLWTTVKYFHPYLAYRDIDWDKALVDALPNIRAAKNSAEYARALRSMLDVLHDPATYAVMNTARTSEAALHFEKRTDGTLLVSQVASNQSAPDAIQPLAQAVGPAANVVFDLRVPPGAPPFLSNLLDQDSVSKLLTPTPLTALAQRTWIHNGLPPTPPFVGSGGFHTAFSIRAGIHLEADPSAREHRIAFILNENSVLPYIGCALWEQGKAKVVAESDHFQFADVASIVIPMGLGVNAVVRLSEPLASREVDVIPQDAAVRRALASFVGSKAAPAPLTQPRAPDPRPDLAYSDMRYPATEYRILAAYKIWAVFHNFFAYRDLMDEDWDEVFAEFLPRVVAAKDAREYNLTLAEMVTHVADSHASVTSAELTDYFGAAPAGLRLRLIEKKPVITEVLDPQAVALGIKPGDIVTKVDGESLADRFHREERYIAASTPQALGYAIMRRILNGSEGSDASLTIEGQGGKLHEVHLKRSSSYAAALAKPRSGDAIKLLPGNIGYADLDRLLPDQVDGMFDQFRSTNAIIFDMRGYPHGTAWSIAPRLTDRRDVPAAIFTGPLTLTPDLPVSDVLTSSANYFYVQKLPTTDKWKYKGKTVMLIDERTISQAEHTGLFLEAANKTEFIGTPSAGADGDVTNFVVPGGVLIWFSGHDVRHANGGALQRLGLQPTGTVAPSIEGIRAGRDEVLEKALEYVSPERQKGSTSHMAALRIRGMN